VENILIGLLGSLLLLDTTIVLQSLISQPLFTCTILGWIFGDIQLGLQLGIYLQILWLSIIPVGKTVIPEGNTAAIITTVLVLRYNQEHQLFNIILVLAVLYSLIFAYAGSQLVDLFGKTNVKFLHYALTRLESGDTNVLGRLNIGAILFHLVVMFLLFMVALILGDILFSFLFLVPLGWELYFSYGVTAILGIGVGLALPMYKERNCRFFILLGIIVGSIILFLLK
jgi:mannose/fructose/N-acetylgalactosamine-specific phosphotransferase system component IIC